MGSSWSDELPETDPGAYRCTRLFPELWVRPLFEEALGLINSEEKPHCGLKIEITPGRVLRLIFGTRVMPSERGMNLKRWTISAWTWPPQLQIQNERGLVMIKADLVPEHPVMMPCSVHTFTN